MDANYFKARREELGLTQRRIALALNMTAAAVGLWENDEALPRISLFDRLAEVYRVGVERISAEALKQSRRMEAAKQLESVSAA